jgi:hypothetical protein
MVLLVGAYATSDIRPGRARDEATREEGTRIKKRKRSGAPLREGSAALIFQQTYFPPRVKLVHSSGDETTSNDAFDDKKESAVAYARRPARASVKGAFHNHPTVHNYSNEDQDQARLAHEKKSTEKRDRRTDPPPCVCLLMLHFARFSRTCHRQAAGRQVSLELFHERSTTRFVDSRRACAYCVD